MKKKIIFLFGFFGTLFLVALFSFGSIGPRACEQNAWCTKLNYIFDNIIVNNDSFEIIFLTPLLLLFSLLTYWKDESVFRAWWGPARAWVITIIVATVITTIIDNSSVGSSVGDFSIAIPVLGLLYPLFIVTSIVNIMKAYRKKGK